MVFAAAAGALAVIAIAAPGPLGIVSLVAVSFFMSIMYPGIYAIGLHGNERYSKPASALMIMSIVAGAVLTAAMGAISDRLTIAHAYLVPFVGFVMVFLFFLTAVRSGRIGAAMTYSEDGLRNKFSE
jgi:FHS family L-fucose permease-like MFS transporter